MKKLLFTTLFVITIVFSKEVSAQTCVANFTHTVNNATKTAVFSNTSSSNITHYYWSFGDGQQSNLKSPTHTYSNGGTFKVILTVIDTIGKCGDSIIKSVTVKDCSPAFDFFISDTTLYYHTFNPDKLKVKWNFGNGYTSGKDSSIYYYPQPGTYTVCLTKFCSATDSLTSCSTIVSKRECYSGLSIAPNNGGSGNLDYWYYKKSSILGVRWDFGDGNSSTKETGRHIYTKSGLYNVCLTVFCSNTDSSKRCILTNITGPCEADFNYIIDKTVKSKVTFINKSSTTFKMKYKWYFGDGQTSATTSPVHTYTSYKKYNVCVEITDTSTKCKDSICKSLEIFNPQCNSDFSYIIKKDSFYFTSSGIASKVKWNFGDGNMQSVNKGSHKYSKPGIYKVCFTAYCSSGDSSKTCLNLSFNDCQAFFKVSLDTSQKFKLYLINQSTNRSSITYNWDFGDGSSSSSRNPSHQYSKFGQFLVCLSLTDTFCKSTFCDTLGLDSTGKLLKNGLWELIVKDETSGLNKIINSNINVYPNPAHNKLFIEWKNKEPLRKIEIININGQICLTPKINRDGNLIELNIENLPKGLFLLRLINDENSIYTRIIKD